MFDENTCFFKIHLMVTGKKYLIENSLYKNMFLTKRQPKRHRLATDYLNVT